MGEPGCNQCRPIIRQLDPDRATKALHRNNFVEVRKMAALECLRVDGRT